jgi:hypothetical protein
MAHVATGYTPFELVYGFKSELPSNLKGECSPQYNYDYFLMEVKSRLETAQQTARERLITAKHKSKGYYSKNNEGTVLYVDETRQYYFTTDREELHKCKSTKVGSDM